MGHYMTYSGLVMLVACTAMARIMFRRRDRMWASLVMPALLVALALDPTKALLLIPIAIALQQIEGNVLIPRIMSHVVGVSPLTVILGILIGSILYGPAGAFLAVPVAAALQVILNHTLRPALEEPTPRVPVPEAELAGDEAPDPGALAPQTR
jgi:hypothetical protein